MRYKTSRIKKHEGFELQYIKFLVLKSSIWVGQHFTTSYGVILQSDMQPCFQLQPITHEKSFV